MRIVVVGNGAGSLNKRNGQLIDSSDLVIRINDYRTSGFETALGLRTDVHMLNSWAKVPGLPAEQAAAANAIWLAFPDPTEWQERTHGRSAYARDYLRCWHNDLMDEERDTAAHQAALRLHLAGRDVRYFGTNEMLRLVDALGLEQTRILIGQDGKLVQPTTGLKAIWLARDLHPSADIKITGFDGFQSSSYYWDQTLPDQYDNHAYMHEVRWVERLCREGGLERLD